MSELLTWLSSNLVAVVALVGGIGSAWRWLDGRAADRQAKREQRYWELLDISVGREPEPRLRARQIAALHLMVTYKEFRPITAEIFRDALSKEASPWTMDHRDRVVELLKELE